MPFSPATRAQTLGLGIMSSAMDRETVDWAHLQSSLNSTLHSFCCLGGWLAHWWHMSPRRAVGRQHCASSSTFFLSSNFSCQNSLLFLVHSFPSPLLFLLFPAWKYRLTHLQLCHVLLLALVAFPEHAIILLPGAISCSPWVSAPVKPSTGTLLLLH